MTSPQMWQEFQIGGTRLLAGTAKRHYRWPASRQTASHGRSFAANVRHKLHALLL